MITPAKTQLPGTPDMALSNSFSSPDSVCLVTSTNFGATPALSTPESPISMMTYRRRAMLKKRKSGGRQSEFDYVKIRLVF